MDRMPAMLPPPRVQKMRAKRAAMAEYFASGGRWQWKAGPPKCETCGDWGVTIQRDPPYERRPCHCGHARLNTG